MIRIIGASPQLIIIWFTQKCFTVTVSHTQKRKTVELRRCFLECQGTDVAGAAKSMVAQAPQGILGSGVGVSEVRAMSKVSA